MRPIPERTQAGELGADKVDSLLRINRCMRMRKHDIEAGLDDQLLDDARIFTAGNADVKWAVHVFTGHGIGEPEALDGGLNDVLYAS